MLKNKLIGISLVGVLSCTAALDLSCTAAQGAYILTQVPNDISNDIGCVEAELLQGALSDPVQIALQCGGLLISQLIALAEGLLAIPSGDAGASVTAAARKALPPHLASIVLSDVQRTRVQTIHDAAVKLGTGGAQ